MGIYDRNYYRDEDDNGGLFSGFTSQTNRSIVLLLIGINVVVFILDGLSQSSGSMGQLSEYLALSETDALQPWYWFRILTAAFAHANLNHIFCNMLVLFFFGRQIEAMYGSKKFLWMYLTAAIGGNLAWLIAESLTTGGPSGILLGASGATTAVFILYCFHFPNRKLYLILFPFFGIPAWIMGIAYVANDVVGQLGLRGGSNIAFLVHLAGAVYAYLFFKTRWSIDQLSPLSLSGGAVTKMLTPKPKLRVHRPQDSNKQDQLAVEADRILKKLHEQGESSLSRRERRILEDYSRSIKQRK